MGTWGLCVTTHWMLDRRLFTCAWFVLFFLLLVGTLLGTHLAWCQGGWLMDT